MKKFTLTLMLIASIFVAKSQTTYISTVDKILTGVELKTGTEKQNATYIIHIENGKEKKLTLEDINGYALEDGRTYTAGESEYFEGGKAFLEILEDGNFKLFYYAAKDSKQYFYSSPTEDELMPLTATNLNQFKQDVHNNSDCDEIDKAFTLLKIKRNSLIRFFRGLNDCDFFPYHRLKVGVNVGLSQLKFVNYNVNNRYLFRGQYDYSYSIKYGLFIELPINLMHGKIVSGINFVSHKIGNDYTNLSGNVKTDINFSALNIPLYFKHNLRDDKMFRPFYELGFTFDHLYQKNNTIDVEPRMINRDGVTYMQGVGSDAFVDFVSKNYFGTLVGIGAEFNINHKSEIRTEIQYSFKNAGRDILSISTFNYSISYIF